MDDPITRVEVQAFMGLNGIFPAGIPVAVNGECPLVVLLIVK
jgi:hypothetical protein